jgi:hypothetical protein
LLQVRVGRRVAEQAAHRDDLALVVKRMRNRVVENERWGLQLSDPIRRTMCECDIERRNG